MVLTHHDIWDKLYFKAHSNGKLTLYINESVERPIELTVTAAEDLLTNLSINVHFARGWANEDDRKRIEAMARSLGINLIK